MVRLGIITPSYRPDFEMFRQLHESVLEFTDADVVHLGIVPRRDADLFAGIGSSRLSLTTVNDLLPRRFRSTQGLTRAVRQLPGMSGWPPIQSINLRRPWPPIRGWILQQVVKLMAAATLDADVVLAVDSDVSFIKSFTADLFWRDGTVRLYRKVDGVHEDMPDHLVWHAAARRLLGLPSAGASVSHDYIAPMVALDPRLVRGLRDRIESRARPRSWLDTLASELHFSEYILYGTYVEELAPAQARSFSSGSSLCHSRWGSASLGPADVAGFLDTLSKDDIAVHVQSTSQIDPALRDAVVRAARDRFLG